MCLDGLRADVSRGSAIGSGAAVTARLDDNPAPVGPPMRDPTTTFHQRTSVRVGERMERNMAIDRAVTTVRPVRGVLSVVPTWARGQPIQAFSMWRGRVPGASSSTSTRMSSPASA